MVFAGFAACYSGAQKGNTMKGKRKLFKDFSYKKIAEIYKRPPVKLPKMPTEYRLPKLSGEYFYIAAKLNGRCVLLGPYDTEGEAYEVGSSKLNTAYEVIPLKTRDRGKATQIVRHRVLNESSNLALSLRRMKHRV